MNNSCSSASYMYIHVYYSSLFITYNAHENSPVLHTNACTFSKAVEAVFKYCFFYLCLFVSFLFLFCFWLGIYLFMVLSFPLFPFSFFPFSLFPNWCAINVNFHVYTHLYLLGSAAADTPVLCDNCHTPSGTEHVLPVPMKVPGVLR